MTTKLTVIKVMGSPSEEYMHSLRRRVEDEEDVSKDPNIKIETIEFTNSVPHMTLIKLGSDKFTPGRREFNDFKEVFEHAKDDPDFKVITHDWVQVETVPVGDRFLIINGDYKLV